MKFESGYLSMTLDIAGVVAYAQHHSDVDVLKSTFPDLSNEQAFAIVDGHATLTKEGGRIAYRTVQIH